MKASQRLQKISAGLSLVILALGFLLVGLVSLIPYRVSTDSLGFSTKSCAVGGWASVATASIFLIAAFVYWRRYARRAANADVQARDALLPGVQPDCVPKSQEIIARPSVWAGTPTG